MKQIQIQNKKLSQLSLLHNSLTKYSDYRPGMLKIPQPKFQPNILGNMNTGAYRGVEFDLSELKAYYKFDEASGNILNKAAAVGSVDEIANSDLVVTGATYGVPGIIDDALSFDGVNDSAIATGQAKTDLDFMFNAGGAFSFVIWVKMDSFASTDAILHTFESGGSTAGFLLNINATTRALRILIGQETVDLISMTAASQGIFPNDTTGYHMICITWDDATTVLSMSIDASTRETATFNATNTATSNDPFRFGLGNTGGNPLAGDLDECSVWGRVLTTGEEAELYNSGSGLAL